MTQQTNAAKLDEVIKIVTQLDELIRGEGHEGMLKKVEKHDCGYNKFIGFIWMITPVTAVSLLIGILNAIGILG